jgi:hypothetical protein
LPAFDGEAPHRSSLLSPILIVRLLHKRMLPLTERFLSRSGKQRGANDRKQEGNVRKASAASVAPIRPYAHSPLMDGVWPMPGQAGNDARSLQSGRLEQRPLARNHFFFELLLGRGASNLGRLLLAERLERPVDKPA